MMHGHPSIALLVKIKHWEINHPQEIPHARGDGLEIVCNFQAQFTGGLDGNFPVVRHHENGVARLRVQRGFKFRGNWLHKFGDASFKSSSGGNFCHGHAASLEGLHKFGVVVGHLARELTHRRRHHDCFHAARFSKPRLGQRLVKNFEAALASERADVMKFKTKSRVWFVAAKSIHGVDPRHARDGWNIHAQHFLPQALHETAHDIHNITAVNKA